MLDGREIWKFVNLFKSKEKITFEFIEKANIQLLEIFFLFFSLIEYIYIDVHKTQNRPSKAI